MDINASYSPSPTHLFEMKGRDARDFLHRLTTANVRDLEPGALADGFFLSPQGKVRAAFRVAARGPDSFYLEVQGGADSKWREALLAVMDQFTFAEKYELRELSADGALANAWCFGGGPGNPNAEMSIEELGSVVCFHGARATFDTAWTSVWAPPADLRRVIAEHGGGTLDETAFERERILALAPRVDRELVMEANPLELGLRAAIADNKGCYPGQEVVEKIISLGSPAKRLALLVGAGAMPAAQSVVRLGDGEVGTITSATRTEGQGFAALALLRKNAAAEGKTLRLASGEEVVVERLVRYE